jgi:hypothetical protein
MKKNTILWVLGYAVVAYGAYSLFFSKKAYAKQIIAQGKYQGQLSTLENFDMGFLRVWAKAAKGGQPTFMYQGKNYNTNGGRAVK